jgi:hypothetical protein
MTRQQAWSYGHSKSVDAFSAVEDGNRPLDAGRGRV